MPLSPTPLSGCPLQQLEIRDEGSTSTVYDAAESDLALTATLEARRSIDGDKNDLMFQSHLGLRRVLSIRLTDLVTSSCDATEAVTIDKLSRQMCIQIRQLRRIILFTFLNSRDFNIFVYTLKKFGFHMKDGIAPSTYTDITNLTRSQSSPTPSSTNVAPRLSSITPLQTPGSSQEQSPFSFTAMLNSEVPLTEMQSLGTQYQHVHQPVHQPPLQAPSQQLTPQVAAAPSYASHQSSYRLHLGLQSHTYQPRVSSPLRNVVDLNSRDTSPTTTGQFTFHSNAMPTEDLLSHRSISEPNSLPQSWQPSESLDVDGYDSIHHQKSPQGSQDTTTSSGSDSQATNETDISFSSQSTQDFRELMPQTRNLPFVKDRKNKSSRTRKVQKQASIEQSQSESNSDVLMEEMTHPDWHDDNTDSPNISQTDLRLISSHPTNSQTEKALACHSPSSEVSELPAILVTDNSLLEKVNRVTSKLLDQFNEDIARGCDRAACAQYYLEQIDTARREFWLNQLKQINYM